MNRTDVSNESARLRTSYRFCRDLTRRLGKNFYYGLKLLPASKRSSMFALYAWMRRADDLADNTSTASTAHRKAQLEQFRGNTHIVASGVPSAANKCGSGVPPLAFARLPPTDGWEGWPAFGDCVRRHTIAPTLFDAMIDGQLQDLTFTEPENFDQLERYCYRVAGVVGLANIRIWGYTGGAATEAMAVDRGVAFQLTNILRDLREDARLDRVYLPRDELARFAVTGDDLRQGRAREGFLELMRWQVERAESFYRRSAALDERVYPDSRPALAAMTAIYHGLLKKISHQPRRVLRGRVSLGPLAKSLIAWRALLKMPVCRVEKWRGG